ncbi:MAG TPA: hypothetical protein VJY66_04230 [Acholeplasma sp.]|nr:hypothetical protein [Acholeplasma sp.]
MNKKNLKLLPALGLLFSMVVFFTIFFDVIKTDDGDGIMDGFKAIFGGEIASIGSFASAKVLFSYKNFIGFILPVLISVISIVVLQSKNLSQGTKVGLGVVLTVVFALSAVMLYQVAQNTVGEVVVGGFKTGIDYAGAKLTIASITAIVASGLGFITSILYTGVEISNS